MKKIIFLLLLIMFIGEADITNATPLYSKIRCTNEDIDPKTQPCKYNDLWKTIFDEPIMLAESMSDEDFKNYLQKLMTEEPYAPYFYEIGLNMITEEYGISPEKKEILANQIFDYDIKKYGFGDLPEYFHHSMSYMYYIDSARVDYLGNALIKGISTKKYDINIILDEFTRTYNTNPNNHDRFEKWFTYMLEQNPYDVIISIKKYLKDKNITKNPTGEKFLKDFYQKALKKY